MFQGLSLTDLGVIQSQIRVDWFAEFPTENCFLSLPSQIRVKYHFPLIGPLTYIFQVIVKFFSTSSDVSNDRKK